MIRTREIVRLTCVLFCFLNATVGQTKPPAPKVIRPQAANVNEAVKKNFGGAVEVGSTFKPYFVVGDFNGDGVQDLAAVVRIKAARSALPKPVRVINPFESGNAVNFPAPTDNKLALILIHSWQGAGPVAFLLVGEAPILILENDRATSSRVEDRSGLIELISKRGRRPRGATYPRTARGDIVVLGSEVGDSQLYWNGRTYVWEDSAED